MSQRRVKDVSKTCQRRVKDVLNNHIRSSFRVWGELPIELPIELPVFKSTIVLLR